jgi:hypothetical protein
MAIQEATAHGHLDIVEFILANANGGVYKIRQSGFGIISN